MASIYQNASSVVLWLGPEQDYTKDAMSMLHSAETQSFGREWYLNTFKDKGTIETYVVVLKLFAELY
jgi:hypothetical protein